MRLYSDVTKFNHGLGEPRRRNWGVLVPDEILQAFRGDNVVVLALRPTESRFVAQS